MWLYMEGNVEHIKVLRELERKIGKSLSPVVELNWDTLGVKFLDTDVIGLGLYGCNLNDLPESIGKLNSLEELFLARNNLKTLPESVGNLKSLRILDLRYNIMEKFTFFSNLQSVQELYIGFNNLS
ncbi:hypothetical protein LCGC14_1401740, partial [marine sediment metagenome]